MNRLISGLLGTATVTVSGRYPEELLNALTEQKITYWDTYRTGDRTIRLKVLLRDFEKLKKLTAWCFCEVAEVSFRGLPFLLRPLKRRPVLVLGMLLAIIACFVLPRFVWVLEVKGCETLHEEEVLRELAELGVKFGADGTEIDSQKIKMQMMNRLPKLSWLAVNRSGGKLTVLVTERFTEPEENTSGPQSLAAAKDGVITDYIILEGMRLCSRGDSVEAGQLLVSGYEDYGLYLRAVRADGEIYARTWTAGTLVLPKTQSEKRYTGQEFRQISLVVGRKRIKICGNSGISYDSCDKMVSVERLTLVGYEFPVTLEVAVYREYETVQVPRTAEEARTALEEAWQMQVCASMVAGTVLQTEASLSETDSVYIYRATSTCEEMIARSVPITELYKGESNEREDH